MSDNDTTRAADQEPRPGESQRIGPYRLLQEIGRGGMGVVYRAEQDLPIRRVVALKVIKIGMDTEQFVARFEAERQALAVMSHPGIAQVYDGGTTEGGRPYFVMEYVPGTPITDFCDAHRLGTVERLDLFCQVCDAVQHAHHKGIIHRDLKPSNILVFFQDDRRAAKIIDFGVAKAISHRLTERQHHTEHGQMIGTPLYMSPEQAELTTLDIDTRSDVYSLGVVLYELLAGATPFEMKDLRGAAYDEIRRRIREEDPPRPSTRLLSLGDLSKEVARCRRADPVTLTRILRDDLDWIVMKALEKDRSRRYASASELSADIGRHLRNEPVAAGPPSAAYRARKFVRRHRFGVAAAAAVAFALVAGIAGTTAGMVRAVRAEAQARREAVAALRISDFLVGLFEVSDPGESRGNTVTAREVLDRGVEKIRGELEEEPEVRGRLLDTMGTVYRNLGLYGQARPLLETALELRERADGTESVEAADSLSSLVGLLLQQRDLEAARPLARRALALNEKLHGPEHPETARAVNNLASLELAGGDAEEARRLFERALAVRERTLGPDHPDVAKVLNNLGLLHQRAGRLEQARGCYERALAIREKRLPPDHPDIAKVRNNLGMVLARSGDAEGAMRQYQMARASLEKALSPQSREVRSNLRNIAELSVERGDEATARPVLLRLLQIHEELGDQDPDGHATALEILARLESKLGRAAEAQSLEERARRVKAGRS